MKAHITQTSYCVPLTVVQWERLNAVDDFGNDRWDEVSKALGKAKAERIEYNGHFGRNLFFSLEKASQLPRVLKTILKLVS